MVDPGAPSSPRLRDPVAVADGADHGQHLALGDVGGAAHRLDPVDDRARSASSVASSFITIIILRHAHLPQHPRNDERARQEGNHDDPDDRNCENRHDGGEEQQREHADDGGREGTRRTACWRPAVTALGNARAMTRLSSSTIPTIVQIHGRLGTITRPHNKPRVNHGRDFAHRLTEFGRADDHVLAAWRKARRRLECAADDGEVMLEPGAGKNRRPRRRRPQYAPSTTAVGSRRRLPRTTTTSPNTWPAIVASAMMTTASRTAEFWPRLSGEPTRTTGRAYVMRSKSRLRPDGALARRYRRGRRRRRPWRGLTPQWRRTRRVKPKYKTRATRTLITFMIRMPLPGQRHD